MNGQPDRQPWALDNLARTYQRLLELVLALLPLAAILYIQLFQDPRLVLQDHGIHVVITLVAMVQGAFIAWVTWRCYQYSGEPFLRWLTVGFVGFTAIYALHGLLTPLAQSNMALFILYGPVSRLVLAACLLAAMASFGRPADAPAQRNRPGFWWPWLALFAFIDLAVALLAYSPLGGSGLMSRGLEFSALWLCLSALILLWRRTLRSPLMTLFALVLANFAQASLSFLLASAWNHQWWLAHLVFAIGFLGLSYGVLKAYFTSRSFDLVFSQEELFERLSNANGAMASALARAHQANAELEYKNGQLHLARQEFESLFAMAPDGVLVVDAQGRVVKANDRALALFGYPAERLMGLPVEELMPAAQRAAHIGHRQHYAEAPQPRMMSASRTLLGQRRDGSTFATEISLSPLDFNGAPCTMAIVRDVTETRLADEQLRISQQRFRDLFDHGPIGMALVRLDGGWQEVNDALCRIVAYPRDELLAMTFKDITHPDDLALDLAQAERLAAGEIDSYRMEKRYIRKDGTVIWVALTGAVLRDGEGLPLHFVAQIEDITDRRLMETERAEHAAHLAHLSHRLVAVQEEERRRLAGVVHDLVSPNLAAVKINLGILGQQIDPGAEDALDRLEDTRALLDDTTSSIRSMTSDLRPVVLDFAGLAPAVDSYAQQFASRTGVVVTLAGVSSGRLPADKESLLFRIVQEALTNCAKHAQAKNIHIDLNHDHEHAVLDISDDGIGFQQEPGVAPSGLGLLTMRERAEFAGGQFHLLSVPGQGTRITVEI